MINTKKNPTKAEVKQMIKEADLLTVADKKEWRGIVSTANQDELNKIYVFFTKAKKAVNDRKLKVVYKAGLGDEYKNKIKSLSDDFIKTAIRKQERHEKQGENTSEELLKQLDNPEDILKELDKL